MQRNRIITIVFCVLAFVLIGTCIVIPVLQFYMRTNIYIFADISECEALETLTVADGVFTKYPDTALDNNLGNLQYTEFFAGEYSCDQYTFQIFAYSFADPTFARTYFENAAGKNSYAAEANYSMASGFVTSHIIAFKGNMAYAVYCPTNALPDVSDLLADCFQRQEMLRNH